MRVLALLFIAVMFTACDSVTAVEMDDKDDNEVVLNATEQQMLSLINGARSIARSCGTTQHPAAPPVTWNPLLTEAATAHSQDMVANDFFSHTGSDSSSVGDRVTVTGYFWKTVGENLYAGLNDAERAVQAWIDSPGHCRNLMDPDFEEVGMDVVVGINTTYGAYWTQVFGALRTSL